VIDVAGGDKVPRKGGPGVTQSDLLVINKTDLAEAVGADLKARSRTIAGPDPMDTAVVPDGTILECSAKPRRRASLPRIYRGRNVPRNRSRGQTERGGILRVGSCTHCMAGHSGCDPLLRPGQGTQIIVIK
jgi:hypothetical protein